MDKVFKFYDYEFNDSLPSLLSFLEEQNIDYKKNNAFVYFRIECIDCKEPIEVRAYYREEGILNLTMYCYPISFNHRKNIELDLNHNYEQKTNVMGSGLIEYYADNYYIIYRYSENVEINVEFCPLDAEVNRRILIEKLKFRVPFVIGGAILSAVFIAIYFLFKDLRWLHVINSIIGIIYAYIELYFMYIKNEKMSKNGKKAFMIVVPIIFFIFAVISTIMIASRITGADFSGFNWIDFFMIIIYMLPSFNVLILSIAAMAYA